MRARLKFESIGKIPTVIHFLQMNQPPNGLKAPAPRPDVLVLRLEKPDIDYYRFLYEQVGGEWQWTARLLVSDRELIGLIQPPQTQILVLHRAGSPAGFAELGLMANREVELRYFGLFPAAIGLGLGAWFLQSVLDTVWNHLGAARLTLNTCNLDHPRALSFYLKAGFEKISESDHEVERVRAFPSLE